MKSKVILVSRIAFLLVIAAILLSGLVKTVLLPKDVNSYENRKANRFPLPTLSSIASNEFQDGVDAAFSDQILKSERAKKLYNDYETNFTLSIMKNIYEANKDKYLPFNDMFVYGGDYLVYATKYPDMVTEGLNARTANINSVTLAHPELDFYTYYIEKETDVSFQGGNKTGLYEAIEKLLDTTNNKLAKFAIDDFETFSQYFYKTDHHWNHKGSYEAYTQLTEFLSAGEPLAKGEEYTVGTGLSGSKAVQTKSFEIWVEDMYGYRFDFPEMSITMNGESVQDYGAQNATLEVPAYGTYYGSDAGELIFDTGNTDKENILVIGESYDNAVLKLLAVHFNKTHSIDLRYYEHYMGREFSFSDYVEEHGITKVLFIGNLDFFNLSDFTVE